MLSIQWSNPADIFSLLLIIGGGVVQTALAQFAGTTKTPISFSFGWVAYSYNLIVSMTTECRLMPRCDYPCRVINLKNGYGRDCRSWLLGRFLADDFRRTQRVRTAGNITTALQINVYDWQDPAAFSWRIDWRQPATILVIIVQIGISAIPWGVSGDWGPFLITIWGTMLSFLTGMIPQWNAEKYACRTQSKSSVAITQGNGSSHIVIVRSLGFGLNLEDLAGGHGPLMQSTWENSALFSLSSETHGDENTPRQAWLLRGIHVVVWITRLSSLLLFLAWVALLITAAGLVRHRWYLLVIGALGMLQNAIIAASECSPQHRGLQLVQRASFTGQKVMDVLMDLELTYEGFGRSLVTEFFPGSSSQDRMAETDWWAGNKAEYNSQRKIYKAWRGLPGSSYKAIT